MSIVRVNRKAAGRVASGHPWIFSSDIVDRDGAGAGTAVHVHDPRGRPLGVAVSDALAYVRRAIADAPRLGEGHGPVNHSA